MRILIMNGPNLGHLGLRQPEIYGSLGMESLTPLVNAMVCDPVELEFFQSNHEGALIDRLERAYFDRKRAPAPGPFVHPPDLPLARQVFQTSADSASSGGFAEAGRAFGSENAGLEPVSGTFIDGIALNAGALTHTSLALADCLAWIGIPCVEVHLSNVLARAATENPLRGQSLIAPRCIGVVSGFGLVSYALAVQALIQYYKKS